MCRRAIAPTAAIREVSQCGSSGNSQNATTRGVGFNINGQRSSGTEILLDGVENVSVFTDGIGVYIPIDATQEFRVQTSNYEPQYGRASGGIVNVSTRSGTNAFHGRLWEFNRLSSYTSNTVLNAQSGQPKGKYTRNQFGFAVGGPVLKDKLFFFGSTEWTRVRSSAVTLAAVPTPQFLALSAPNTRQFFADYAGGRTSTSPELTPRVKLELPEFQQQLQPSGSWRTTPLSIRG